MIAAARRAAYAVVLRVFEDDAYADRALDSAVEGLDDRDRALAQRLAYGTVQRARTLDLGIEQLGKFDLITAFEVFEHVPDVRELMSNLCSLLSPNGLVLFSTLLSDGNIHSNQRISWWYASPRNGHISLFSRKSLEILAQNYGVSFGSFSGAVHFFVTKVPPWADHIIRMG